MPKLRRPEQAMTDHLSARLPAGTLERIDRAGNGDRQQGARAVIAAGLDALEGLPVRAPERSAKDTANAAALDVDALADAVADRVVPAMADAVAYGVALRSEKPPVPVEDFSLFDVR